MVNIKIVVKNQNLKLSFKFFLFNLKTIFVLIFFKPNLLSYIFVVNIKIVVKNLYLKLSFKFFLFKLKSILISLRLNYDNLIFKLNFCNQY